MRLLGIEKLEIFVAGHADAGSPLSSWRKVVSETDFEHFPGLKRTFGSASYVKPYTVFNISGNKYRLVTLINYDAEVVEVIA